MGWTSVHTAYSRPDAEVIGAILRGHGIKVFIASDDAGETGPDLAFSNGVEVRVRDADVEAAVEILERRHGHPAPLPADDARARRNASSLVTVRMVAGRCWLIGSL